jgi:hypothetical protein
VAYIKLLRIQTPPNYSLRSFFLSKIANSCYYLGCLDVSTNFSHLLLVLVHSNTPNYSLRSFLFVTILVKNKLVNDKYSRTTDVLLGLVRLSRNGLGIVPANQNLYNLEKKSSYELFQPLVPWKPNGTLVSFISWPRKRVLLVHRAFFVECYTRQNRHRVFSRLCQVLHTLGK